MKDYKDIIIEMLAKEVLKLKEELEYKHEQLEKSYAELSDAYDGRSDTIEELFGEMFDNDKKQN